MKRSILFVSAIGVILAGQSSAAAVPIESNAQYEAQISFFKDALDEFGATAPDQAVRLWVKGDETRNGVFKYAVGSEPIKQWLIDRWGKPEKSFWIIGGSSPSLSGYEIVGETNISPTEIKYTVKYIWSSTTGPDEPSVEKLTVTKENENWRISKVNPVTGPQYY